MAQLIIIRGLPGSGKSTMAQGYVMAGFKHFEADMFFVDAHGNYNFVPSNIKHAHQWCQDQVRKALVEGYDVVVSNTFTQKWEMQPYLDMMPNPTILEAKGSWKNVHGVPDEVIAKMRARWETI